MQELTNPIQLTPSDHLVLQELHPQHEKHSHRLSDLLSAKQSEVPDTAGLYAFWWTGSAEELNALNRKVHFQGKKHRKGMDGHIAYNFEWPVKESPQCL